MPSAGDACRVSFRFDAPEQTAEEQLREAMEAARAVQAEPDEYSRGGVVERLETAFAKTLGKERAVFMPTGTLANHLAVRALARGKSRVLLQEQGHLYNDSGDCLQRLSGLNAIPLGHGKADFDLDEVNRAFRSSASARVTADIGALVIETPVRRMHGRRFDTEQAKAICAFCRERGVGLHMDGARLFIESAYTGIPVQTYAALFDTVYLSLYKYFGAPSGAVLAGPAELIDGLYHDRRMFGGGLNQVWMFAAMALRGLEGFAGRFARAVTAGEEIKTLMATVPGLRVSNVPAGTNVFRLETEPWIQANAFRDRLWDAQVRLPSPESGVFYLKVNESILAMPPAEIAERFASAIR